MSSARSASATTSLPKPGALTPAGTGRSSLAMSASRWVLVLSRLEFGTFGPRHRPIMGGGRHPTGSRALTQPRQHLEAGIAVGRVHADLFLEGENGFHSVAAGAAVDTVGLEAALVEAALDLLDLIQRRRAFAAGELLAKRRVAANEVAEMEQGQRVAGGRVVGIDRAKILPEQESRPAGNRLPEFHLIAGPRKGGAIGALHAELLPFGVSAHGAVVGEMAAARQLDLAAPGFAAPVFAALDQIMRGAGQ